MGFFMFERTPSSVPDFGRLLRANAGKSELLRQSRTATMPPDSGLACESCTLQKRLDPASTTNCPAPSAASTRGSHDQTPIPPVVAVQRKAKNSTIILSIQVVGG